MNSRATETSVLELPAAPSSETGTVKAWQQSIVLKTYLPAEPDPNPLFLEKRVYQGSSGKVYPLPVIDRVATEPCEHAWQAMHLENEYLRLMIMPELGGRIHVGYDKINRYDFFYRQDVIKPALVGLAGPWISGGSSSIGRSIIARQRLCRSKSRSSATRTARSPCGAATTIPYHE